MQSIGRDLPAIRQPRFDIAHCIEASETLELIGRDPERGEIRNRLGIKRFHLVIGDAYDRAFSIANREGHRLVAPRHGQAPKKSWGKLESCSAGHDGSCLDHRT